MRASLQLYGRLLAYVRPYWRVVVLSIVAMAIAASLEPVLPALLQRLVDEGLINKNETAQWQIPLFLMLGFMGKGLAEYLSNVSSQWVAHRAVTDIRQRVFRHQLHLPISVHEAEEHGRMLSRIVYDIQQVGQALSKAWIIIVRDTLIILGLVGYLLYVAWELTMMIVAMAPVAAWLIRIASKKLRGSNRDMQRSNARMTGTISEALAGLREIKIFGGFRQEEGRFRDVSEQLRRETMRTVRVSAANVPMVQVVAATAVSAAIFAASQLSAQDRLSTGEFVSFFTAMSMLFEPIRRLTSVNSIIQKGLAGADSIFNLLDTVPERDAEPVVDGPRAEGYVRMEAVSFRYPGQEHWAVRNLSIEVQPGQTVALVGPSGSGKTTVVNLLARFHDPQYGRILLDGKPISECELGWLRSQIAWVGQHVVLFDDTVTANIAYGHTDVTEDEIIEAAKAANAWDFIQGLQDGLDTRLGPNGSTLSGGQRQRIAIARAFLKDAPILLLDEATAALDNESERAVKDALDKLREHRSVLVIAHRLSTIQDADRIVVMDHGRVVETGSHDELRLAGGQYAKLLGEGLASEAAGG